jgi:hypothetical protein
LSIGSAHTKFARRPKRIAIRIAGGNVIAGTLLMRPVTATRAINRPASYAVPFSAELKPSEKQAIETVLGPIFIRIQKGWPGNGAERAEIIGSAE